MRRNTNKNYRTLRSRLIAKGTTLRRWALTHNYPVGSVYNAARRARSGVKAVEIQKALEKFLNE